MRKIIKNPIFTFIIGIIITGSIGVYAAAQYSASQIEYKKNGQTTVEGALNDLYNMKTKFENSSWIYTYKAERQVFNVPISGKYKLEVWGAQGGDANNRPGGYGGYSVGTINIDKTKTPNLYIYVGGKGESSTSTSKDYSGGYNGGGNSYHWKNPDVYAGGGGGATHIAKISGTLEQLENKKGTYSNERKTYDSSDILIVAGGGGGSGFGIAGGDNYVPGGSAGGYIGNAGIENPRWNDGYHGLGGSQNAGGESVKVSSSYPKADDGSFGKGGNSSASSNGGGAGGGAGFFGGGGSTTAASAGGGSGFIGNPALTNKHMACNNCTSTDDSEIKTISNQCHDAEPKGDCAKEGNGYVIITYLGD